MGKRYRLRFEAGFQEMKLVSAHEGKIEATIVGHKGSTRYEAIVTFSVDSLSCVAKSARQMREEWKANTLDRIRRLEKIVGEET